MPEEREIGQIGCQRAGMYRQVMVNKERAAVQKFEGAKSRWLP